MKVILKKGADVMGSSCFFCSKEFVFFVASADSPIDVHEFEKILETNKIVSICRDCAKLRLDLDAGNPDERHSY